MGYNKKVLRAIDRELKDRHRSKRYSKSLSATNSLFAPNYLFSKPSKRRIYNPNAKYFKHGGPQMHNGGIGEGHPHDPPNYSTTLGKNLPLEINDPDYKYIDYAKKYNVDLDNLSIEDIENLMTNQQQVQDYWQNQTKYKPLERIRSSDASIWDQHAQFKEDHQVKRFNDYIKSYAKYHTIPPVELPNVWSRGLDFTNADLTDKGIRRDDYPENLQRFILDNTTDHVTYIPQMESYHGKITDKQDYDKFPLIRMDDRFNVSGAPGYQQIDEDCTICPDVNIPEYDPVMLERLWQQKTLDDLSYEEVWGDEGPPQETVYAGKSKKLRGRGTYPWSGRAKSRRKKKQKKCNPKDPKCNQYKQRADNRLQHGGPHDPPTVKQRRGVRKNPDGTVSSHLMRAEYIPEIGWVAFPSLFQDDKPYADDQQNWVDMSWEEDWMKVYEEADRRGEVYYFGEDKEAALAFGMGSWKDQLPERENEEELYNMKRARELGYERDGSGHLPSVDDQTGMFLKSMDHPTAFKEYMYGQLNKDIGTNTKVVVNPEGHFGDKQLQYIELNDEEADKYRAGGYVLEELHEGGEPGHTHKNPSQPWKDVKGTPSKRTEEQIKLDKDLEESAVVNRAYINYLDGDLTKKEYEDIKFSYTAHGQDRKSAYTKGVSEKLLRNITPQGYGDLEKNLDRYKRYQNDSGRNKDDLLWYSAAQSKTGKPIHYKIPKREDMFSLYLGLPQKNNSFSPQSEYKPTNAKDPDALYWKPNYWTKEGKEKLVKDYLSKNLRGDDFNLANERNTVFEPIQDTLGISWENPKTAEWVLDNPLGDFTVSQGKDDKGSYISIYDIIDFDPLKGSGKGASVNKYGASLLKYITGKGYDVNEDTEASSVLGAGKPYEIYDRIYYNPDDYKKQGGYVLEELHNGGEGPGHPHQSYRDRWNLEIKQNQDMDMTRHVVNERPLLNLDGTDPDAGYNQWINENIDYGTNPNKSWFTHAYEGVAGIPELLTETIPNYIAETVEDAYDQFSKTSFMPSNVKEDLYHLPANLLAEDYSSYPTRGNAFAQARADGKKDFMYKGKRYNTRREDDDIKLVYETDDPDEQYVFKYLVDETKKDYPILWNLMNKASGVDEISFDGTGSRWISKFQGKALQNKNRGYFHEGYGFGDGATIHVGEHPFEAGNNMDFLNVLIAELAHRTGHQPSNNPLHGITHRYKSAYESIKHGDQKRYQTPGTDEFNNHRLTEPGIHMTVRGQMTPAIVKKVQNFLGVEEDGIFGEDTYLEMVDRFKDNEHIKASLEEYAKEYKSDQHPELPINFGESWLWADYLQVLSAHVPELTKAMSSWGPYTLTLATMDKPIPFTKESFKNKKITDFNIRELQTFLAQQGYKLPNSLEYVSERYGPTYDGIAGDETKTAFKNYRKKLGYKKQGGSIEAELTPKEVARYVDSGHVLEEMQDGGGKEKRKLRRLNRRTKRNYKEGDNWSDVTAEIVQPGQEGFDITSNPSPQALIKRFPECPPFHRYDTSLEQCVPMTEEEKLEASRAAQSEYFDEAKQWVTDWHNSPMYNQMVLNSYNGNQANADYLTKLRKKNIETIPELNVEHHTDEDGNSNLPKGTNPAGKSHNDTGQIDVFPEGYDYGPSLYIHEGMHSSDRPRELYKSDHPSYKTGIPFEDSSVEERIEFGKYFIDKEGNIVDYPDWMTYNDPRFPNDGAVWRDRVMPVSDQRYINTHRGSNWTDNEQYKLKKKYDEDSYKYATDEELTNLIIKYYDIQPDDPAFAEYFDDAKKQDRDGKDYDKKRNAEYSKKWDKKYWKEFGHDYVSKPSEVRGRLGEIRFNAQKEGIYDPFTEQITPEIFQNYINKERDSENWQPMKPILELREDFTDEEIIEMLNTISKSEETSNILDDQYAQEGGSVELGDEVDEATMKRLKKLGYTFKKV